MNYLEFLKANREDIIDTINDEIMFTDVKVVSVMQQLAAAQIESTISAVTKEIKRIVMMIVSSCLHHDPVFEAVQSRIDRNCAAAL